MAARQDLISVVEACYDLRATDVQWLQGVADGVCDVLQPGHGVLAYHIDIDTQGFRIRTPVQCGATPPKLLEMINSMSALLDKHRSDRGGLLETAKAKVYARVMREGFEEPADRVLQSEYRRFGPKWMYTLGMPVVDVFALLNHHVDGNGVTAFFGGLARERTFRAADRATYQMLSAHIKAGLRLRRKLPEEPRSVDAPPGGAVLSASGRVLHAEGDARDEDSAAELRESAARIDSARCRRSGRSDDALAIWQGLIDGRWSLVETFDVDGQRFLLAHRNPENVRDPRGLTTMESRVVGLAVRGYSDKLIAYHLGVAEGTASSHLTAAMRKLRIGRRVDLVRRLGTRYPQAAL